jgi:hypothetical protein
MNRQVLIQGVWVACALLLMLVGVVLLALTLGGCTDFGYRMNELHGLNCRPEALQDGKCVSTKEVKK